MTTCQLVFSPGAGKADCWELPFPCASQQRWGWQPFRWLNIHQTEFVCCFALLLCTLIASEFIVVLESALQDCELRLCALLEKMNDTTATLPEFNKWFGRGYWYCKRILRVTVWPKLFWGATTFSKACSFGLTNVFSNKSFPLCNFCRNLECTWCRKQILHRKYGLLMGKDLEDFDLFCKDRWDSSLPKVDVPSPQVIHLSAGQAL